MFAGFLKGFDSDRQWNLRPGSADGEELGSWGLVFFQFLLNEPPGPKSLNCQPSVVGAGPGDKRTGGLKECPKPIQRCRFGY